MNLPGAIAQKLQQTLAQWQHWHCEPELAAAPRVLRELTGGSSNFSVLVEASRLYVVRIDGIKPSINGLNRQSEWRTLQAAAGAGLAPRPRYFNPEIGSLVCDYLPAEPEPEAALPALADLLKSIHSLPPRHNRLDLAERILRYEKLLQHKGGDADFGIPRHGPTVAALLAEANPLAQPQVLCHNDLLTSNRLYSGGRWWALDWEYSAMGDALYDIAVVIHGDQLGAARSDELVAAYLGRRPTPTETGRLARYGCIYRYLELLWYLALERPVLSASAITARAVELEHTLAAVDD